MTDLRDQLEASLELETLRAEVKRLRMAIGDVRSILRENWSSKEWLLSDPPKHIVCYRAWELLGKALGHD